MVWICGAATCIGCDTRPCIPPMQVSSIDFYAASQACRPDLQPAHIQTWATLVTMSPADQHKSETIQPQVDSMNDEPGLDGSTVAVDDGTAADRADMFRLGKTQELRRNFRFLTIFGFSMILMCTWEGYLSMATVGLVNGGTAGTIWMFFICWTGFLFINTSMAEMASM